MDGSGPDNSTGSVEDILRILAGERYLATDGLQMADAVPNFAVPVAAEFVNRPNVELPESVRGNSDEPVRGRNSFVGKTIPTTTAVQDTTAGSIEDVNFRDVLAVMDTGRLQQSAINGALEEMASPSWAFQNSAFTYGGGATPAQTLGAVNIGTDYIGRAVSVYAADGSVIV